MYMRSKGFKVTFWRPSVFVGGNKEEALASRSASDGKGTQVFQMPTDRHFFFSNYGAIELDQPMTFFASKPE